MTAAPDRFEAAVAQTVAQWRHARRKAIRSNSGKSAIHAWRICTRRLFALEELLAPAPERGKPDTAHAQLARAFRAAGRLRDRQVAIEHLQQLSPRFSVARRLHRHLQHDLPRRRDRVTRHIEDIRPRAVRRVLRSMGITGDADPTQLAARAGRRLQHAFLQLRPGRTPRLSARQLHRYRLQLKSLRYMEEFRRAGGLPAASCRVPAQQMRSLQARLGEITDIQVLLAKLDRFGRKHPTWRDEAAPLRRHLRSQKRELLERLRAALPAATTYGQCPSSDRESLRTEHPATDHPE